MHKGALHIHSTYSDGELSIPQLRETYLAAGCRFICVSDHADWFDEEHLQHYLDECAALSDARFTIVPGLEYPCVDRMHIVGFGATVLTQAIDPSRVIAHIHAQDAVSVIAHPKDTHFSLIEELPELPQGLEVWNSKYDGRYAPRARTFALLARLRARRADLHAFYGQDLHWRTQYRGLFVHAELPVVTRETILHALRRGAFEGEKEGMILPSSGELPAALLATMDRAQRRSQRMRALMRSAKRMADLLGLRVPVRLKAQARRVM